MADRYWVGGTGTWNTTNTTNWSATSGGSGGATVPGTSDDVFFDANSGTATVTVGSNVFCRNLNFTGYTGTFAGGASSITVENGSVTLVSGMTYTFTGSFTCTGGGTGTFTSAGKTVGAITINGSGRVLELGDAFTSSSSITVTQGAFTTNNFNVTATAFQSSNSNARTINLGSSTITLTTSGTAFNISTITNLTFSAGTSQFVITSNTVDFFTGGLTLNNVSFTGTSAGTRVITGANTFNNLSVTAPSSAGVAQVSISGNQTINGTLSVSGTAGNERVWFRSDAYGVRRTLTVNGSTSLTDADFRDIIVNGTAAPISGTRIGNRGACVGITFDVPKTVYWVQFGSGNWSSNSWSNTVLGTANTDFFPLPQDTAVVGIGISTVLSVTIDAATPYLPTVDLSQKPGVNNLNVAFSAAVSCYGSWTNGTQTQISGTSTLTFEGQGTKTITSAGKTFSNDITINTYDGTVELADAINTGSRTLTITNGTFDTKNFTVSVVTLSSSNGNVRTIKLGSSTVNASINAGAIQIGGFNLILDAGTSQINITGTGNFSGGGYTYNNVSFTSAAGTRAVNDQNTFNNLTIAAPGGTNNVFFNFGANQTINGTLTISAGTSAIRRTSVFSNIIGTQRTLTCNAVAALTDLDFRDIAFAGNCVSGGNLTGTRLGDCGGNSGITFPAPKTVYWNLAGTQNWSATAWATGSGGTPDINNFPLAQDTAVFDDAGAAGTVTLQGFNIGSINASARTSAMTLNHGAATTIYGNYTLGSGVTLSGSSSVTFSGRGTQVITSAGKTLTFDCSINSATGVVQLADALNLGTLRVLFFTSGTFDAVTYNVTLAAFQSNNSNVRTLRMGSGLWTIASNGGYWDTAATTNLTFFKGTADILFSSTGTSSRSFSGGGLSYNKLIIGGTTGTSTTSINQNNNQFTEIASTKTVAHTIDLGAGLTQIFGKWSVTGSAGNVVTIAGSAQIQLVGSSTSGIDYLALGTGTTVATGAAGPGQFFAGANSTGTGAGVILTAAPTPRTLYWVGGTGNWTSTAKWSLSSGGAGGQPIPTTFDDVIFDSASNATSYTATIDATSRCNSLTIAGPASGSVTLAGTSALIIHGNVTLPATGLIRLFTGQIILSGSTTGKTLTTNGVQLQQAVTINGVGCGWTLGSALDTLGSSFTVTNGSFDTGNYNVTIGNILSTNANTRAITLGSSTIQLNNSGATSNFSDIKNLTFDAGTSQINITGQTNTLNGGGLTFNNVSYTSTAITTQAITGSNTFNNLIVAGRLSAGIATLSIAGNQTINGTLILYAGSSSTTRMFVRSDTLGVQRDLICNAVASLTDIDFRDIEILGAAAPVSGTRLGDCGGNNNITFPAPKTVYKVGSGDYAGGWSDTSGGTANPIWFPLPQDTGIINNSTPNQSINGVNPEYNRGSLDFSARTTSGISINNNFGCTYYGSLILSSVIGLGANTNGIQFSGRGTMTLVSAGLSIPGGVTVDAVTGTLVLGDSLLLATSSSRNLTLVSGTFNAATYNVTCGAYASTGTNVKTLRMGSGLWTLTGTGTVMNAGSAASNMTLIKETADILLSDTSTSSRGFTGDGQSFNKLTIGGTTGTSTLTISQNNTFTEIASTKTVAHTIALGSTIQRVAAFTVTGTAGNVVTITGTGSNLIYTGGGLVGTGVDYLNVQGRVYGPNGEASGIWYAGANSVNSGSLGWEFSAGGSVIYNVSITEAYTSGDDENVAAMFNAAATENSTLDDIEVPNGIYGVTITENSDLADVVSPSFTLFVSVTEPTTLADLQQFVNLITVSITEGSSAGDSQNVSRAFTVQATEGLTANNTQVASATFFAIALENSNTNHAQTVQGIFAGSRTEGIQLQDITNATGSFGVSLIEALVAFSQESGGLSSTAEITENFEITEGKFIGVWLNNLFNIIAWTNDFSQPVEWVNVGARAMLEKYASSLEGVTSLDSYDRTAIFVASLLEAFNITDEETVQGVFNSGLIERINVADDPYAAMYELLELFAAQRRALSATAAVDYIYTDVNNGEISTEVEDYEIQVYAEVFYADAS